MNLSAEEYFNLGKEKYEQGLPEEAISFWTKTINLKSIRHSVFFNRGLAYFDLGQNEKSIEDFDIAIQLNPTDIASYTTRALAKSKLCKYYECIEDCNFAININPHYAIAYTNRGIAKSKLDLNEEAIEDCNIAIQLNTNFANAYMIRGTAFKQLGDLQNTLFDYNRFLYLTDSKLFFQCTIFLFPFYSELPSPFLIWHKLKEFADFTYLNLINPIIDQTRQQCHPTWYFLKLLAIKETEEKQPQYYLTEALINFYMGDPIASFRIYEKKINKTLMEQYYFIESAKLFLEPHTDLIDLALDQIEKESEDLIEKNAYEELFYAGLILYKNNLIGDAHDYFQKANDYLPAAFMQVLTLLDLDFKDSIVEQKKIEVQKRDNTEGRYLNGFPKQYLQLDVENHIEIFKHYAHYKELLEAINEINNSNETFEHNEMWEAFRWRNEDIEQIDKLERDKEIKKIVAEIEEKFSKKYYKIPTNENEMMQKHLEHPKRYEAFEILKNQAIVGKDMELMISNFIYQLNEDSETYTLIIKYFFAIDKKLDARNSIMLQCYNIYMNRHHRHNTEATEEGFVESVQPIIGVILGSLVGDLTGAIVCGGLSVVLKNTIKKLILGGDKTIYVDFKNAFLKNFSYLKETTKGNEFDAYFGIFGFDDFKE